MLKIWGHRALSNMQVLMWGVGELGLDYEHTDAGLIYGVVDTPEYLSINPNGTVPTVVDGDNPPLWESGAILRYLAAAYGSDDFWPRDPVARADVDRGAEWSKINIGLNFAAPLFVRTVRTAPSKRDAKAIEDALRKLTHFLDIAEAQLATNPSIAGDRFTLADLQFGHCLYRYFDIDIARPNHPQIRRYYDALTERPAYREHVMISYEELRVTD
jgi:glutathione S-transferase